MVAREELWISQRFFNRWEKIKHLIINRKRPVENEKKKKKQEKENK